MKRKIKNIACSFPFFNEGWKDKTLYYLEDKVCYYCECDTVWQDDIYPGRHYYCCLCDKWWQEPYGEVAECGPFTALAFANTINLSPVNHLSQLAAVQQQLMGQQMQQQLMQQQNCREPYGMTQAEFLRALAPAASPELTRRLLSEQDIYVDPLNVFEED